MIHIALPVSSTSAAQLASDALTSVTNSEAAMTGQDGFLINPWLGLIGLGVLVISGAVAVIREIEIEEEDIR